MPTNPDFLFDGPADAGRTIVLAHGAGAGMDTPFMTYFATSLAKCRSDDCRTPGAIPRYSSSPPAIFRKSEWKISCLYL